MFISGPCSDSHQHHLGNCKISGILHLLIQKFFEWGTVICVKQALWVIPMHLKFQTTNLDFMGT